MLGDQQADHNNRQSNFQLSTSVIHIDPRGSGQLTISNIHHSYCLCFKIKTSLEKKLEVRPPKGIVKAGEKTTISFKTTNAMEAAEKTSLEKNLQFLVQFINQHAQPSKEEEFKIWKSVKDKSANISLGHSAVKLKVSFSQPTEPQADFIPRFTTLSDPFDHGFKSMVKSKAAQLQDVATSSFKPFDDPAQTEQQAAELDSLKKKQQELVKEREKLLLSSGKSADKGSKGGKKGLIIVVVVFVVAFLVGNGLKSVLSPAPPPPPKEKGFFSFLG